MAFSKTGNYLSDRHSNSLHFASACLIANLVALVPILILLLESDLGMKTSNLIKYYINNVINDIIYTIHGLEQI